MDRFSLPRHLFLVARAARRGCQFLLLPIMVSALATMLAMFPLSPRRFCASVAACCRWCADGSEALGESLEGNCGGGGFSGGGHGFSEQPHGSRAGQHRGNGGAGGGGAGADMGAQQRSVFDLDMNFGRSASLTASMRGGMSMMSPGEEQILSEVGSALAGADAFPLVIPPEFIEISKEPVAAGGFAQVGELVAKGL